MIRDDSQLAAVCQALVTRAGLSSLWTPSGPSERAKALLKENGGPLSSGERILLLTAWAFWNGKGNLTLPEVIEKLDRGNLIALGDLLVAFAEGPDAIDGWIDTQNAEKA